MERQPTAEVIKRFTPKTILQRIRSFLVNLYKSLPMVLQTFVIFIIPACLLSALLMTVTNVNLQWGKSIIIDMFD
jgi:branched-subunit amino acid transport protein